MNEELGEQMSKESYELLRSLTNISPSRQTTTEIEAFRDFAKEYARAIVRLCPDSREKSLAKTKLEESVMWAVKAIVLHQPTSFED